MEVPWCLIDGMKMEGGTEQTGEDAEYITTKKTAGNDSTSFAIDLNSN